MLTGPDARQVARALIAHLHRNLLLAGLGQAHWDAPRVMAAMMDIALGANRAGRSLI